MATIIGAVRSSRQSAPGGVGKSLLSIAEALAMVTGKPLLGEATRGGLKVMLMNYEDSELVLRHRVTAAMLHYGIKPAEIDGKLFVESIGSDLMRFAKGTPGGTQIVEPSVEALTRPLRAMASTSSYSIPGFRFMRSTAI